MKFVAFFVWLFFLFLNIPSLVAQDRTSFFQSLSWEQASLYAVRENKLILVKIGAPKQFSEKKLMAEKELLHFLQRNVIAVYINSELQQEPDFMSHLLMYEPPLYAFLMPYGDLLSYVSPDVVAQNPAVLRESFEKAKELAAIKKRNSRSVYFEQLSLEEGFAKSEKSGKPIALYFSASRHQPSLLLEKNVLSMDEVADLYNQSFINLKGRAGGLLSEKYGIYKFPAFVFLNAQGKVIYRSEQLLNQRDVLNAATMAIKRAEGLQFQTLSREEALKKATMENKSLFFHYYRDGNSYKELVRTVFADPEVVDFFEKHFINVAVESDQSSIFFLNSEGEELHRVKGSWSAEELLDEARKALGGHGLGSLEQRYFQGEREAEFLERYLFVLDKAGEEKRASEVARVYFQGETPDCLLEGKYWKIFEQYVQDPDSEQFKYMLSHRGELNGLYGAEIVKRKERAVWVAGADVFARNSVFDEVGFKEYTKRMKKAKVENWRTIVRDARMHIAEKLRDWKTFIALAEVKWNEEKLADVELYRWGNLIYEHCQNEDLRYQMAQWLAERVVELERQERTRGMSTITSYRGVLEKLVNDLLNK